MYLWPLSGQCHLCIIVGRCCLCAALLHCCQCCAVFLVLMCSRFVHAEKLQLHAGLSCTRLGSVSAYKARRCCVVTVGMLKHPHAGLTGCTHTSSCTVHSGCIEPAAVEPGRLVQAFAGGRGDASAASNVAFLGFILVENSVGVSTCLGAVCRRAGNGPPGVCHL